LARLLESVGVQHAIAIKHYDEKICRELDLKVLADVEKRGGPEARARLLETPNQSWRPKLGWYWWDTMDPDSDPIQGGPCETREQAVRECLESFGVQANH
jgi:hypothetical protein